MSLRVLEELLITKNNKTSWPKGWRARTCLMAVINITPDSFSDGGYFYKSDDALSRAGECIRDGADVLDLGAQSTRPGSNNVGPEEEIRRLKSPIISIRSQYPKAIISVDTYQSKVADLALELGANWINDVTGGRYDEDILKVVANYGCPYVLTHSRGDSKSMDSMTDYMDVTNEVIVDLYSRTEIALKNGIKEKNIIWDPGLGFAKNNIQSIELVKNIGFLCSSKFPILIGPSRKRFIGSIVNEKLPCNRIWGNAAVVSKCVQENVDIVRVHDIKEMKQVIQMSEVIK